MAWPRRQVMASALAAATLGTGAARADDPRFVGIAYAHERVRLHDLKVGIARTQPPYGDEPGIQEGRHASSVGGQSSRW